MMEWLTGVIKISLKILFLSMKKRSRKKTPSSFFVLMHLPMELVEIIHWRVIRYIKRPKLLVEDISSMEIIGVLVVFRNWKKSSLVQTLHISELMSIKLTMFFPFLSLLMAFHISISKMIMVLYLLASP